MFVRSRGFAIHIEVHGAGDPVLLLHEFGGSTRSWTPYVRELSARFTLVAVDALGHGLSDRPHDPDAYSARGRVEDFVAVLDGLGIGRAHVWGYSMGGRNAWAMLAFARERMASLIVGGAGPPVSAHDDGPDYLEARAEALMRNDWQEFWKVLAPGDGEAGPGVRAFRQRFERENDPRSLAAVSLALREWPPVPSVGGVPRSCHYAGERDGFLPRVQAGAAALGGEMHVMQGVGHDVHFRAWRQVATLVRGYLESSPGLHQDVRAPRPDSGP